MTTERNVEPMLRRWLVDGVDQMPERVYLSILDRVERQPQRRTWPVSWRAFHVNSYLKPLLAVAAIVVVAVAGFAILRPSGAGVGGPAATETSPAGAFGGTVHYQDNGEPVTTEVDGVASGATVAGTAVTTFRQGTHTVRLACVARDGDTWALGGTVEKTTLPGETVGAWSAVIVKDGSSQRIAAWLSGSAPAGSDCLDFLGSFDFTGPDDNFVPVESGALLPPPDPVP